LKNLYNRIVVSAALAGLLCLPVLAQQPEAPAPPAPAPTPAGQDTTTKPSDQTTTGEAAHGERQGKSKLEKETGTVNDRILTVMPNYTVENADKLPPISTGQKYRLAAAGVFDYFTYPFNAALAGLAQANNSPKSWGQGWGAYGKRYGASFADNGIGTFMTTAVFPSMLHEDPRYYQLGHGSIPHRTGYALVRLFWTRTDSGGHRFNYSETLGNAAAAALSNTYHAPEDRTWGRNLSTLGTLDMWDGVSNLMKEFWPDIHRKMQHKHNTDLTPAP